MMMIDSMGRDEKMTEWFKVKSLGAWLFMYDQASFQKSYSISVIENNLDS